MPETAAAAVAASRVLLCRFRRQKKNAERPTISRPPTTPTTAPTIAPVFERRADCVPEDPPGRPSLELLEPLPELSEPASLPEPESPKPRSPNPASGVDVGSGPDVNPPPACAVSEANVYKSAITLPTWPDTCLTQHASVRARPPTGLYGALRGHEGLGGAAEVIEDLDGGADVLAGRLAARVLDVRDHLVRDASRHPVLQTHAGGQRLGTPGAEVVRLLHGLRCVS